MGSLAHRYSDSPVLLDNVVTLTYSGGALCHEGTANEARRATEITFVCDQEADGRDGPEFVSESDNCTYHFRWATSLACKSEAVECTVQAEDGSLFDLSPLTKYTDNWHVGASGSTVYEINVCKGLEKDADCKSATCGCSEAWAACQVTVDGTYNTGLASPPMIDPETGHVYIEYHGGQLCHDMFLRSTRVDFVCDAAAGLGEPRFVTEEGNCQYRFLWVTAAACAVHPPSTTSKDCSVHDPITRQRYNLTGLATPAGYHVVGDNGFQYDINVCQPLRDGCGDDPDAAGCQLVGDGRKLSLGKGPAPLLMDDGVLKLRYKDGAVGCGQATGRTTEIIFVCNKDVDVGTPTFLNEFTKCMYVFQWETKWACPLEDEAISCQASDFSAGEDYDLTPLIHNKSTYWRSPELVNGPVCAPASVWDKRAGMACGRNIAVMH